MLWVSGDLTVTEPRNDVSTSSSGLSKKETISWTIVGGKAIDISDFPLAEAAFVRLVIILFVLSPKPIFASMLKSRLVSRM